MGLNKQKELQRHFLSHELSKEFKKLGFNKPCFGYWRTPNIINRTNWEFYYNYNLETNKNYSEICASAPLISQAIEFLRKKYNYVVETLVFDKGFLERNKFCYHWRVYPATEEWVTELKEFKTYEQAQLAGIACAIELIKKKQHGTK